MIKQNPSDRAKPTIWIVIGDYYPSFSGAAIQAQEIYSGLVRQGFPVTVLTLAHHASTGLRQNQKDGISIRYFPVLQERNWSRLRAVPFVQKLFEYATLQLIDLIFSVQAALWIWNRGQRGDILQVISLKPLWLLILLAGRRHPMRGFIQMTLMNSDDPSWIKQRRDKLAVWMSLNFFRQAEMSVGCSSGQVDSYLRASLDPHKVMRIPAGIDVSKFYIPTPAQRVSRP